MKPEYWSKACKELSKRDKTIKPFIECYPDISVRKPGTVFHTLARAIVGQQISVKAAKSIWERFETCTGKMNPEAVLKVKTKELRACGLSEQKTQYITDLAKHFRDKKIQPKKFPAMADEELIETLCDVRGIGRWTAEMFLLFHLKRPDIFPVGDIGLIRAIERHYYGGKKVKTPALNKIGEIWRPFRSVGTWYMWRSLENG